MAAGVTIDQTRFPWIIKWAASGIALPAPLVTGPVRLYRVRAYEFAGGTAGNLWTIQDNPPASRGVARNLLNIISSGATFDSGDRNQGGGNPGDNPISDGLLISAFPAVVGDELHIWLL
jgi:hypothetical protein